MSIHKILEKSGLSPKEVAVYLACLDLEEANLSDIARRAKMARTSCYNVIETLVSKGLLNTLKLGAGRVFVVEDPEKLLIILREQEAALKEAVPKLKSHYRKRGKPSVYFYDGTEGIGLILEDILDKQYPLLALTSIDDALKILDTEFTDFIQRRGQKHIPVKLLTYKSEGTLRLKGRDELELRQTRFLSERFKFSTAQFVYGDRVAFVSFQSLNPFGLIVEDVNISQTQRLLFENIWECSNL